MAQSAGAKNPPPPTILPARQGQLLNASQFSGSVSVFFGKN